MTLHQIVRVRHNARRRILTVERIEALTPRMMRMHFISDDLHDFVSASPDDHIKLFFPMPDGQTDQMVMRDFTPRRFDTREGRLAIDFALHEAGPAISWAKRAQIGDALEIGGPRGSKVMTDDFDWYLLVGDETALPAMGRRVEELRAEARVITLGLVSAPEESQVFETRARLLSLWAIREKSDDEASVLWRMLDKIRFPEGDGMVWIAAEAATARAIRSYVIEERSHPKEWVRASGYWARGQADAHETIGD